MCGIAGYLLQSGSAEAKRSVLESMCGLLSHRGPDGSGVLFRGQAGLGHRRLSIIDLAGGAQPMATPDGSLSVVFNGEIYNFPELKQELRNKGYAFQTNSDTEVLLHGYHAWGTDLLQRLNGMFAFALWDEPRKLLLAARDRLGKKPLYYHAAKGRLLFASEMKSILAEPEIPRRPDPEAIDDYFSFGYIPSPRTIFLDIQKLRPGHYFTWQNGELKVTQYWDVIYGRDSGCKTEDDYVDKLEILLSAAVKRRLISDVPLGAFLSGGLDSSVVVGLMARVSGEPVRTFTIGFEEKEFSELADARLVSKAFGTLHREHIVRPDALSILPTLVWHFDEPFADSSAVPTYYVCQAARKEVTVILSGDGGDELFAGYRSYQNRDRYERFKSIPSPLRSALGGVGSLLPWNAPGRNLLRRLGSLEAHDRGDVAELFPPIKQALYSREWGNKLASRDPASGYAYWTGAPAGGSEAPANGLSRLQYLDTKVYLPEDIMTKVDRMSMANSLETRAPLLDYNVAEFAATIPPEMQMKDGKGKYILRKLAARFLPPEVLTKKKQGFAIPREKWFQGELRSYAREILTSSRFNGRGYFRPERVDAMLKEHDKGTRDYSMWIWSLINFELWSQAFLDGDTRKI
ncbi:MAG: asparagine synthase (glutamine-hydrolyzing) [Fibrobacterota bacterium]|nr:asparagine synthase (glutamine-hydrolyzing) [Fibrobacterota bacterium]